MNYSHSRRIYADHSIRGLYIDSRATGKSFRFRFTDASGKPRSITLGREPSMTLEDAKLKALDLSKKLLQGDDVVAERQRRANMPLFRDYIEQTYLPHSKATKRSYEDERQLIANHLLPAFGDSRLHQVKKIELKNFVQTKLQEGYNPSTVNRMIAAIKMVFNRAEEWDLITTNENPARGVRGVRVPVRVDRFLSPEEAQRLQKELQASESPMLQFVIAFLLLTGARKREALDAKWSHFDFERATWTIPLSKSGKPRYVPLSPSASDVLKKLQAYSFRVMGYRWQDCEWVFPNPRTRKPFINIFFAWNRARQRAGLPDVRIHDLRHSFASALVNEGMTLYDVKELLGHSNMATTTRYAHLSNKRLHTVAAVAGQHFGLGNGEPPINSDTGSDTLKNTTFISDEISIR